MQLWRPRSPMICSQQAGDPGLYLQTWGPAVMMREVPDWEQGKINVPAQLSGKKSKFAFLLPLILLRPSMELCDAHLHWRGHSVLFDLQFQMLISSRNILKGETKKKMFNQISGRPVVRPVKLIRKITDHISISQTVSLVDSMVESR